jgi:hypothetical protein
MAHSDSDGQTAPEAPKPELHTMNRRARGTKASHDSTACDVRSPGQPVHLDRSILQARAAEWSLVGCDRPRVGAATGSRPALRAAVGTGPDWGACGHPRQLSRTVTTSSSGLSAISRSAALPHPEPRHHRRNLRNAGGPTGLHFAGRLKATRCRNGSNLDPPRWCRAGSATRGSGHAQSVTRRRSHVGPEPPRT